MRFGKNPGKLLKFRISNCIGGRALLRVLKPADIAKCVPEVLKGQRIFEKMQQAGNQGGANGVSAVL